MLFRSIKVDCFLLWIFLVIDILTALAERIFESLEINYANSLPIDLIERSIKEKA